VYVCNAQRSGHLHDAPREDASVTTCHLPMYPTSKAQQDRPDLAENDSGFVEALAKLPTKAPGTIRLFERAGDGGGFFSAHGDDALFVAQHFYNTNSVLKYFGGKRAVPSCTLSRVNAIAFLRDALTARQLKIEIWSGGGKKSYDWKLSKQVRLSFCRSETQLKCIMIA
jgi:DNA mismatch repair protein MSH2